MRRALRLIGPAMVMVLIVAACGETHIDGPGSVPITTVPTTTPPAGLVEGNAFVTSVDVVVMESFPVQVQLEIDGDLPTPCHTPAWEAGALGADNTIEVQVFSLVDPEVICATVLEPFSLSIPLGSFQPGSYTILVNGEPYPLEA